MIPTVDAQPFTPRFANNFGGYMSKYERELLVALARIVQPRRVLEIGVQRGEAARILLNWVHCITNYVGVDVEPGYVFALPEQERAKVRPYDPGELVNDERFSRVLSLRGSFDLDPDQIGKFDMVLIDGEHSREAVTHDSALADKVVNNSGLIVWHDYGAWCKDITDVLNARHEAGHALYHAKGTMLAWELVGY